MTIDVAFLSNLRFDDHIIVCIGTPHQLQRKLSDESRQIGLNMNIAKRKVIVVDNTPIITNNVLIENVEGYEYIGQHYSIKENTQYKEIQRRIMTGLEAYANNQNLFKINLVILPEETILQLMCAASNDRCIHLDIHQTSTGHIKMEISMLSIRYKDNNVSEREDTSHRHYQQCDKNRVVLGRTHPLLQNELCTLRVAGH